MGGAEIPDVSADATIRREQFQSTIEEHGRALVQLAYFLSREPQRAEELAAEAQAKAWPKWRAGLVEDLPSYLRRAVVNLAYKDQRHNSVARRFEPKLEAMITKDPSLATVMAGRVDLVRAVLQLPVPQRTVIVLRYFEDMPEAEIASTLGVSVGTVKSRTARGLATLRSAHEFPPGA